MRQFSFAILLLAMVFAPAGARGGKPKVEPNQADTQTYAKALERARAARVATLEGLLANRRAMNRQAAKRLGAELRRLKSDKPLPRGWGASVLKVDVNAPATGQVGTLRWGKIDDATNKRVTVERVLGDSRCLARARWEIAQHAVAGRWDVTRGPQAPSVEIGRSRHEGPMLLFVNVPAAGLRAGTEVKTADVFVVEGRKIVGGEPAFVLRRLEIDWKAVYKR